jgi:hypothetical protein
MFASRELAAVNTAYGRGPRMYMALIFSLFLNACAEVQHLLGILVWAGARGVFQNSSQHINKLQSHC